MDAEVTHGSPACSAAQGSASRLPSRTCRLRWPGLEAAEVLRGHAASPKDRNSPTPPYLSSDRSSWPGVWPRLHCGTSEARVGEVNAFIGKPRLRRFAERGRSSWMVVNSVCFAGKAGGSAHNIHTDPHTHIRWVGVKPADGELPTLW